MMTLEEASKIARRAHTPRAAAQSIVEKAYYRGMAKYDRLKDDTTYCARCTRTATVRLAIQCYLAAARLRAFHVVPLTRLALRTERCSRRCVVVDLNPSLVPFVPPPGGGGCCQLM